MSKSDIVIAWSDMPAMLLLDFDRFGLEVNIKSRMFFSLVGFVWICDSSWSLIISSETFSTFLSEQFSCVAFISQSISGQLKSPPSSICLGPFRFFMVKDSLSWFISSEFQWGI